MRRLLALMLPAALVAALSIALPSSALVSTAITGQLFDYRTGAVVGNSTVQLREVNGDGSVGAVVTTGVTAGDGTFSLTPPDPADAGYWVEVLADSRIQHGYVDDHATGPSWLQWDTASADQIAPGTDLGHVNGIPSFVRGTVVNAANGNPLGGIRVSLRDAGSLTTILGTAVTNSSGWFRISGIEGEDFGLRVIGRDRGFETGWLACNNSVVRTWGAACAAGPGGVGRVRLDRL